MLTEAVEDAAYRALSHPDRRRLLRLCTDGEQAAGTLARAAELSQPIASQHLKVLRDAGLVTVRVDGNRRLYSVDFVLLAELRGFIDGFWAESLQQLKRVAEARTESEARTKGSHASR